MPLFWGPELCRPPGCLSSRSLVEFRDFPRTHQTLGLPRLVSPRVPPGEGEPRSKSDRGTKRGFPPRTKQPPATQSPVLTGCCLPAAGQRLQDRGAHGFAGLGRPRWDTRVGQCLPEPSALLQPGRGHWAGASRGRAAGEPPSPG